MTISQPLLSICYDVTWEMKGAVEGLSIALGIFWSSMVCLLRNAFHTHTALIRLFSLARQLPLNQCMI